jgi:DegV family protein with EDD domain
MMDFKVVVDSGCDLNDEIKSLHPIEEVPLNIVIGDNSYTDDETLDLRYFLKEMKNSSAPPQTSSPSPNKFMQAFEEADSLFVVTLSSKISSTYNSALIAKDMFMEQSSQRFIHVFDSLTASVGETLVSLKIIESIRDNLKYPEVIDRVNQYIKEMHTYFLLDSLDHLIKSGRLGRLAGTLATWLSVKPILGASAEGTIDLVERVRGSNKAFQRFIEIIGEKGESLEDKILGIAHCNCIEKALSLKDEVLARYHFKDVVIVEMGPTISAYADEGGLLIAF